MFLILLANQSLPMHFFKILLSFLKDKEYQQLLRITGVILVIGTVTYHYLEGWSWLDALYFSVITLTTIGYGDYSPQTTCGKVFTLVYIVVGIGIILGFINTIYLHYQSERKNKSKKK